MHMGLTLCKMAEDDNGFVKAQNRKYPGLSREAQGEWEGPFCFLQAADTQYGMIDSYVNKVPVPDVSWSEEIALSKKAIEAANKMQPRPKFFIVCGDLVDAMPGDKNKPSQEKDFKSVFRDLDPSIPLVCVCGNHDVGNTPTKKSVQHYRDKFGDDFFSFWVGGVKFLVLNSQFYEDASQVPDMKQEQDEWLDRELSDAKNCKHLVIFQHIPWFTKEPDEEKFYFNIEITLRQAMLKKFRDAGVRYIFCGHYHMNAGGFYHDLELVVTSAIGAQMGVDKSGMRVVCVNEDAIHHTYYDLESFPTSVELT